MAEIDIYKHRTNIVLVRLGFDVSADTITSQIRANKTSTADLIAEWDVSFETDGTDGVLRLEIDDSVTELITHKTGYMDLRRVSGGEPYPVFAQPVKVNFKDSITLEVIP